jgi:hypothetical protein
MQRGEAKLAFPTGGDKAMAGRKTAIAIAAAIATAGLCAEAQAANHNVDFLRGCWVAKKTPGGPATGFLRLFPEGRDYAGTLTDILQYVTVVQGIKVAQDGSNFTLIPGGDKRTAVWPGTTMPPGFVPRMPNASKSAFWLVYSSVAKPPWIVAEGNDEHVNIYMLGNDARSVVGTLFEGERDGCD